MKREIIFRGKRSYNEEWVQGSLVTSNKGSHAIIPFEDLEHDGHHLSDHSDKVMFFDQDTLGQFTGLTDKNGVKLFEGDIIKILYTDWASQDAYLIGFVEYKYDRWYIVTKCRLDGHSDRNMYEGKHGWKEVIGNIHDNPELISQ